MKYVLLFLIRFYQICLRPLLGAGHCRFYPTCSEYAQQAIRQHGVWRGLCLSVRRLGCCHPLHPGGIDPVPDDWRHPCRCADTQHHGHSL